MSLVMSLVFYAVLTGFYAAMAATAEATWVVGMFTIFATFMAYRMVALATWERRDEAES